MYVMVVVVVGGGGEGSKTFVGSQKQTPKNCVFYIWYMDTNIDNTLMSILNTIENPLLYDHLKWERIYQKIHYHLL